jgi:hypothetical protein
MLEIVFVDAETGEITYAITNVNRVRYITPSEVGFDAEGRPRSASFPHTEKVEIHHIPVSLSQRQWVTANA